MHSLSNSLSLSLSNYKFFLDKILLNFVVKITVQQKLQNITDIYLCVKVLHRLYVKKSHAGKVSEHSKKLQDNHKYALEFLFSF